MQSIYDKYFEYESTYTKQYGAKTVILMMVGSFFEVYGLKNNPSSIIHEFSRICQMNISEKKKVSINGSTVLMAGFPEYTLERYVQKLSDAGYTSVVIVQDEENSVQGGKKKHMVHSICSPGTFMPADEPRLSNNIMCIWLHTYVPLRAHKTHLICGIAIIDICTGQSHINEFKVQLSNDPTTYDELERAVSVYNPSEVIILYKDPAILKNAKKYSGMCAESIHEYLESDSPKAINAQKQQYVSHMLDTVFYKGVQETCMEFSMYHIGTQAYCFLLDFIQEHNPSLIKRISEPVFANPNTNVILANSTLKQLNIIDDHSLDGNKAGRCSSVLNFVNRCSTAMGKRRVQELVCNPVFDTEWLQKEYNTVEHVLINHNYLISFVRSRLQHVMDIERLERSIKISTSHLCKVPPSHLYKLNESLQHIQQIHVCLQENAEILEYTSAHDLDKQCVKLEKCLNKYLDMDACKNNIVQMHKGIDEELDAMNEELAHANTIFANIHGFFNMALKCTQDSDAEFVKINTTEKSGSSLQITKVRAKLLKQVLDTSSYTGYPCFQTSFSATSAKQVVYKGTAIDFRDLKLVSATGSCDEITFKQLDDVCATILRLENAISKRNSLLYDNFISEVLEKEDMNSIVHFVIQLDIVICKAYLAKEYRLCKPELEEGQHSRVYAEGLRHLLIEQLQQNETYVANNVSLDSNGILLYGTNAVGKTSLIRALGIATVLAQSGFYVPCSSFTYTPFKSIYTRILGNDNLYKGLSTFAVEMSELRVILKNADQNSLILGDELCSGTETQSALSIFVAGLQTLALKNTSFIFATHFHEIVDYEEIKALNTVMLKHMAVHYDPGTDKLVYDRVLRDGPGDNMYGLEVCKSLHMPTDFMDKAFALRNKYFPTTAGTLSMPTSHYNANKIRGMCEKCGTKISTEVHHVLEQRNADADGFIKGTAIRKNHKANLLALCEACHLLEHK